MASLHVQLKGKAFGKPSAVRSPFSERSAARIERGSLSPVKMRLMGSCGVPSKLVPVKGQIWRVAPPADTETRPAGAGSLEASDNATVGRVGAGEVGSWHPERMLHDRMPTVRRVCARCMDYLRKRLAS